MNANEKTEYHFRFREVRGKNLRGGEKIKNKTVVILGFVLMVLMSMTATAEAKTYNDFAGHSAVQYYQSDIKMESYGASIVIERVEYDTDYNAKKPGVRLYLTSFGKFIINEPYGSSWLEDATSYVTSRSEWRSDRSYGSVATEIAVHCKAAKIDPSKVRPTHVEYFYKDLKWWERPVYGR